MERNIFECKRCGHKWMSRKEHPILCAKCHSAYWDTPKSKDKVPQEGEKNEDCCL